jgi:hypothetical protein
VGSVTVNAHVTSLPALSTPPPLHAVLVVYVIQLVPFDTHFFGEIPMHAPFVVPPVISSHAFNLHVLVPVVAPTATANIQTPSVPFTQPASTYDEQVLNGIHLVPSVVQDPDATENEAHPSFVVLLEVASPQSFNLQTLFVTFQKHIPSVPLLLQAGYVLYAEHVERAMHAVPSETQVGP